MFQTSNSSTQIRHFAGVPIAWWVAAASAFGLALGYSAFATAIFGQLTLPLSGEFSWSLARTTGAHALATAVIVVAAPIVGVLSDRFGAWRVLACSLVALPLAVAHVAAVDGSLLHFYIAIGLIALLGSGTLPITYTKILVTWFVRKRGLALGVCLAGVGAGMSITPAVMQSLTQSFGWRTAVVVMAAAMACIMLPLGWLFLRQEPRSAAEVDGGTESSADAVRNREPKAPESTLRESLLSRTFFVLAAVFIVLGAANLGLIVNFMPILREEGLEPALAAQLLGVFGVSFAVTRVIAGWFLDRFPPGIVAFVITLCPAIGALLLFLGHGPLNSALAMVLFAVGMGGEFDVMAYFVARHFPTEFYGRLYSAIYSLYNCGAVIGPVSLARYHDLNASFSGSLLVLAAGMAAAACAFLIPPSPRLPMVRAAAAGENC